MIKKFNDFIKESLENIEGFTLEQLYELGADRISDAANFMTDPGTKEWDYYNNMDPQQIIDLLRGRGDTESMNIADGIEEVERMISEFPDEDEYEEDESNW